MVTHLRHQPPHSLSRAPALIAAAVVLLSVAGPCAAKMTTVYYRKSCPNVQKIVTGIVTTKQIANPTTAAGTLRVFFHDCFVGGCDASVLVSSNHFNMAERDTDINHSLAGDAFDVVVRAKTALEIECPGIVSCADILALATRDLVVTIGGPFYPVRLGRKDSLTSGAVTVEGNLPRVNWTIDHMIKLFATKGFSVQEMVALTGAHTVGFSHCKEFASRIFNFNGGGPNDFDPSMNPLFAQALQKACFNYQKNDTIATFNDIMTPGKFDNMYYQNLLRGLGLLATDNAMAVDPRTRPYVHLYAENRTAFFADFGNTMQKLSLLGVKTGRKGEIRRRCDQLNSLFTNN